MNYADTSFLLKLVFPEPESEKARGYVEKAGVILISSLALLEMRSQIRALLFGGSINRQQYRRVDKYTEEMVGLEPFTFRTLEGTVFQTGLDQLAVAPDLHCRTLDRLHLAAMRELGGTVLLTFDLRQAKAARALGFHVAEF